MTAPAGTSTIFLDGVTLPTLSINDKEVLYAPITIEELQAVVKEFKNNKAPGRDGLPVEVYKNY